MSLHESLVFEQAEYEKKFCFAVMHMPEVVIDVCGWLDPERFHDLDCKEYWRRIKDENIRTIDDAVAIAMATGKYSKFSDSGTGEHTILYRNWADEIEKLYFLRTVMARNQDIVKGIADRNWNAVRDVLKDLGSLSPVSGARRGYTAEDMHVEFVDFIKAGIKAINTGIPQLNDMIGGYFPQELIMIAARPGVGKTAFTMHSARQIAFRKKERVLYISIEMPRMGLWARMACGNAGVAWMKLRSGNASAEEQERVILESDKLQKAIGPWLVVDDEAVTFDAIQKSVVDVRPDVVFIDQLGEIMKTRPDMPQHEWLEWMCHAIRQELARGREKPVIINHHINRGPENREDKRPTLSDFRGSGGTENRVDIGLALYREDLYGRDAYTTEVPIEIIPLKVRQGSNHRVGVVMYDLQKQWFT